MDLMNDALSALLLISAFASLLLHAPTYHTAVLSSRPPVGPSGHFLAHGRAQQLPDAFVLRQGHRASHLFKLKIGHALPSGQVSVPGRP